MLAHPFKTRLIADAEIKTDRLDARALATLLRGNLVAGSLGLEDDLGSLETGKVADLVVLDHNPLDDINNTNSVRYVMKDGRLWHGETTDQVWPEPRRFEGFYWSQKH